MMFFKAATQVQGQSDHAGFKYYLINLPKPGRLEVMMSRLSIITLIATLVFTSLSACSTREVATGAAVGGAAYEFSNKRAMDQLKEDYESGRISSEEYERRKKEIGERSLVY